jgi:hypothetical protein
MRFCHDFCSSRGVKQEGTPPNDLEKFSSMMLLARLVEGGGFPLGVFAYIIAAQFCRKSQKSEGPILILRAVGQTHLRSSYQ